MFRGHSVSEQSPIEKQNSVADRINEALGNSDCVEPSLKYQRPISLNGIAIVFTAVGFFILALTGSLLAWQNFGKKTGDQNQSQSAYLVNSVATLERRIADMGEANRILRSELDSLAGPGGVLPRIIGQLQNIKTTEVAQTALLQQLLSGSGGLDGTSGFGDSSQTDFVSTNAPIQVTPVHSSSPEMPQTVVVTPQSRETTKERALSERAGE